MFIGDMSFKSPSIRRLAMMTLAASVGWNRSQKKYLDLSPQTLDIGPHGARPPNLPAIKQHDVFTFSKPATHANASRVRIHHKSQIPSLSKQKIYLFQLFQTIGLVILENVFYNVINIYMDEH